MSRPEAPSEIEERADDNRLTCEFKKSFWVGQASALPTPYVFNFQLLTFNLFP